MTIVSPPQANNDVTRCGGFVELAAPPNSPPTVLQLLALWEQPCLGGGVLQMALARRMYRVEVRCLVSGLACGVHVLSTNRVHVVRQNNKTKTLLLLSTIVLLSTRRLCMAHGSQRVLWSCLAASTCYSGCHCVTWQGLWRLLCAPLVAAGQLMVATCATMNTTTCI